MSMPIYLTNPTDFACKDFYYSAKNYTKCGYHITDNFPYQIIDHTRVQYIPFYTLTNQDYYQTGNMTLEGESREVYIADSNNHCIRKLNILTSNVLTVAGMCGQPGFADGYFKTNLLNTPEMVGIDALGYLFIYDAGNKAIRLMEPNGFVHTLIDGACREDKNMQKKDIPFKVKLRGMVCYKTMLKST